MAKGQHATAIKCFLSDMIQSIVFHAKGRDVCIKWFYPMCEDKCMYKNPKKERNDIDHNRFIGSLLAE